MIAEPAATPPAAIDAAPTAAPRFGPARVSPFLVRVTELLEARFRVPWLGWRFGLDAVIGLVPVVGDLIGLLLGLGLIAEAVRLRRPAATIARMLANLAVDAVLGTVPLVGDLADFTFRANARNLGLLNGRAEGRQ